MSSPNKKLSSAIDSNELANVKTQKTIKLEENDDDAEANGMLNSYRKKFVRKTSLGAAKKPLETDESPGKSQLSNESQGLVGRSARVRKAKIVFDPSDIDGFTKRKSASAVEMDVKPKKMARMSDIKKEVIVVSQQPSREIAKQIDIRRKTVGAEISTSQTNENGCIICTRSDVKKGRFVLCINCPARGHFTCLRNAKLLSTAPEEKHWQCTKCLRCANCNKPKELVSHTSMQRRVMPAAY